MHLRRTAAYVAASSTNGGGWSPWLLGSSLLAWWDAEHGLITQSSGAVSAWADAVGGYVLGQTSDLAKPAYSASSFNGRPGVAFNGTTTYLEKTSGLTWPPTGAAGSETWTLMDETALAASTSNRTFFAWGSAGSNDSRQAGGVGATTQYRARMLTGDGGAAPINLNTTTDIFGRHVIRYVVESTQQWSEVDGVAFAPTAVSPATAVSRMRMGANASPAIANYAQMIVSALLITAPLTTAQADNLRTFLARRLA